MDLLLIPLHPKPATASMKLRRHWSLHVVFQLIGLALVLAIAWFASPILFPSSGRCIPTSGAGDWWLFVNLAGVLLALFAVRRLSRVGDFLRGRGRPSSETLILEEKFSYLVGACVLVAMGCCFLFTDVGMRMEDFQAPQTKGRLGAIRSALSIYYGDHEGIQYPATLNLLTVGGKYLSSLPVAQTRKHKNSNRVTFGSVPTDAGGWLYENDPESPKYGGLIVNCTHKDTKGNVWTTY